MSQHCDNSQSGLLFMRYRHPDFLWQLEEELPIRCLFVQESQIPRQGEFGTCTAYCNKTLEFYDSGRCKNCLSKDIFDKCTYYCSRDSDFYDRGRCRECRKGQQTDKFTSLRFYTLEWQYNSLEHLRVKICPSRFPCCVFSYFQIWYLSWNTTTDKYKYQNHENKSQLSRAIY